MPGVPSGRGCEACRKQKKKCDQSKPACSRCTRLQIACTGSGQQRYKFKEQKIIVRSAQIQPKQQHTFIVEGLSRVPTNDMSMIAGAFTSTLEVIDPRYDLACYGGFLKHVPKRLGNNEALDASVEAITTAFSSLHTRQISPEMYIKYGHALKVLRTCLCDPLKAQTSETLCAIYLVMICQIWIGRSEKHATSHGVAMAHILNALAGRDSMDEFETEMLITLSVSVILEKVFNPRIELSPKLLALSPMYGPLKPIDPNDDAPIQSLMLPSLSRFPDFIQHPQLHFPEIQFSYQQMLAEIPMLRRRLAKMEAAFPGGNGVLSAPPNVIRPYAGLQTAWVLIHTLAMVLNGILRGYDPYDFNLVQDASNFANEIMIVAKQISQRRPLGASYIPVCLTPVWIWASDNDESKLEEIEEMWAEYSTDFMQVKWRDVAIWVKAKLENLGWLVSQPFDVPYEINFSHLETGG